MARRGSIRALLVVVVGAFVFLASPRPAEAYLDPASGTFIIQVVVAAMAAAAVTLRAFWSKLKSFFGRPETHTTEPGDEQ